MDDELGGYILVPRQGRGTPLEMMRAVLTHLRAEAVLYRLRADAPLTEFSAENLPQLLRDSQQRLAFTFVLGERWGSVSLEMEHKDFFFIHLIIDKYALDYPDEAYLSGSPWPPEEPVSVSVLVENWRAICEGVRASFGYFSSFPLHSDETYLNNSILPYLRKGEKGKLLQEAIQTNWLLYLGADLVAQGGEALIEEERKKQPLYLAGMAVQKTSSGGLFVRTHPDAKGGLYPDETFSSVDAGP